MRILIVDADKVGAAQMVSDMRTARFVPDNCFKGDEALEYLRAYQYDLAAICIGQAAFDGLALIRDIRAAKMDVPVIAIVANPRPMIRVTALTLGADDVMARPTGTEQAEELIARCRAITRRAAGLSKSEIVLDKVRVLLDSREVFVEENPLHLTNKEFEILQVLVKRRNQVISKETFLTSLYGGLDTPDPKIIDVFICKLRKKLKNAGCPELIKTAWGRGYIVRSQEGRSVAGEGSSALLSAKAPRPGEAHI